MAIRLTPFAQRIWNQTKNVRENFGQGLFLGAVVTPFTGAIPAYMGYVNPQLLNKRIADLCQLIDPSLTILKLNCKDVRESSCPITTLLSQVKSQARKYDPKMNADVLQQSINSLRETLRFELYAQNTFINPISTGIADQGVMQDLLLYRLPRFILQKIAPSKVALLDTRTAKIFRIALVVMLSYSREFREAKRFSNNRSKQISEFALRCILGAVKESKYGLAGSIGLHMVHGLVTSHFEWSNAC